MTTRQYVVQTTDPSAGTTKIAVDELRKGCFEPVWLKTFVHYRDRLGQTRATPKSLFAGYVFVAFDESEEYWKSIKELRGIRGVLGAGERPIPLPIGALDELIAQFEAGVFQPKPPRVIAKGDRVEIVAGPFSLATGPERIGICEMSDGERITVLMKYFGHQRVIPMRADMVRMVAAE